MADDPSTPTVLIAGRKGGRPRAPEPGSRVTAYLTEQTHDQLIRLAASRECSVSALVRFLIERQLPRAR